MAANPLLRDPDWLRARYWDDRLTLGEVAELAGISKKSGTEVRRALIRYGIPVRTRSEARIGRPRGRPVPRGFQPCGTYGAYQQHKLRGEQACDACLQANRDYKNAHQRKYQQQPEPRARRLASYRKYRTGLTQEMFDRLLEYQGHACAICRSPEPGGKGSWHIDHDHACCPGARSCGKCVRGLLCGACNMALGLLHDDPARLQAALRYLDKLPVVSRGISGNGPSLKAASAADIAP
jgi:hypothetical protein